VPDILQAVKNVVQSFIDDEPKPALHIGEAMSCWAMLAEIVETEVQTEVGINSTTNPELRKSLHEAVNMFKSQKERLTSFMRLEGVHLPPLSESKPISDPTMVPLGVKLTDNELANSLLIKVKLFITSCANAASQTVRNDIGLIWAEFLQEYITLEISLKSLMTKRGWLKVPPFYYPPGSPDTGR
jgi:spore coat protein CotF